jgi:hypothetical protein
VQDDDLFEVIPPALDADPWDHPPTLKLRTDLLDRLRAGSVPGHDDLSSARALTRLVRAELEAFGTGGGEKLRSVLAHSTSDTPQPRSPTSSSTRRRTRPVSRRLRPLAAPTARLHGSPGVPPGPVTGPVGVGESCWGVGRRPVHSYGWRRRGVGLDWMENPCPSKGFRPHSFPFSSITSSVVFSTL